MLVAISDIHFVDGTAGKHNLPYKAFESVFLADIAALAKDKGAKELKVLLLGDVIDLIRSTKWFDGKFKMKNRPWGAEGLKDIPKPQRGSLTEAQCLKILGKVSAASLKNPKPPESLSEDTILYQNWDAFKLFRELEKRIAKHCRKEIPVQVIYVPGNHDRLCNLYPSLRKDLQKILGLTISKDAVEGDLKGDDWWYRYQFVDEDHGVYARHGHQFDIWNFGGGNDFTREGHLLTPIGDVFTTEFAVKIPWMLNEFRNKYKEIGDEFVKNAQDIDNVRPLSHVMEWLYYRIKKEDQGQVREALDKVFENIVKELLDIRLVQRWRSPQTHIDEALRIASSRWLSWLTKELVEKIDAEDILPLILGMTGDPEDPEKDIYTQAAYNEIIWRQNKNINFILYGHTHMPLQRPLDGGGEREVLYINTGTWRNRIHKTVGLDKAPDFIDLKQMTYTIFYRRDEDSGKVPNTLSFDMWTGTKKKYYAET